MVSVRSQFKSGWHLERTSRCRGVSRYRVVGRVFATGSGVGAGTGAGSGSGEAGSDFDTRCEPSGGTWSSTARPNPQAPARQTCCSEVW